MYFVADRYEYKELAELSKIQKLKSLLVNIYVATFLVFDFIFVKKQAFAAGNLNYTGLYVLLIYFFAS